MVEESVTNIEDSFLETCTAPDSRRELKSPRALHKLLSVIILTSSTLTGIEPINTLAHSSNLSFLQNYPMGDIANDSVLDDAIHLGNTSGGYLALTGNTAPADSMRALENYSKSLQEEDIVSILNGYRESLITLKDTYPNAPSYYNINKPYLGTDIFKIINDSISNLDSALLTFNGEVDKDNLAFIGNAAIKIRYLDMLAYRMQVKIEEGLKNIFLLTSISLYCTVSMVTINSALRKYKDLVENN